MRYFIIYIITCAMVVSFSAGVWSEDMQQSIQAGSTEAGEVEDAGNAFCPVMGGAVDKNISYVYEGKRYYFCCPMCIGEFKKNPDKYIAKMEKMQMAFGTQHHGMMMLSGQLENGVRVVKVEAFRYGFSPDPIVVKKGERVRFEVTSRDVTHGLAIKDFGINISVPPGKSNTVEFVADKIGDFDIHCSVYCGPGHAKMRGSLKVVE